MATINANVRWADNTADLKRNLLEGIGTIDAMKQSVDRTVQSLGGAGLFGAANKLTAAILEMGGVTKLTTSEMERHGATLDRAIEKYKVMGMTAPPAMKSLADEMRGAGESGGGFMGFLDNMGHSFVARVAEGVLLRDAIREVIGVVKEVGQEAISNAVRFDELSRATGLSTQAVQEFAYVGKDFGLGMDEMARGVEQLSTKLAHGDKNASSAVAELGLSVKDLLAEGPKEAFLDIVEAVNRVADPMQKDAILADLFGAKLGRIIAQLPDMRDRIKEIPQGAMISKEAIDSIHEGQKAWDHFWTSFEAHIANYVGGVWASRKDPVIGEGIGNGIAPLPPHDIALPPEQVKVLLDNADLVRNKLDALRKQSLEPLTAAQKANINELKKWGEGEAEIASDVSASAIAVHLYLKSQEDAATASKKAATEAEKLTVAHQKLLNTIEQLEHGTATGFAKFGDVGGFVFPAVSKNVLDAAAAFDKLGDDADKALEKVLAKMHDIEQGNVTGFIDANKIGGRIFNPKDERVKDILTPGEQLGGKMSSAVLGALQGGGNPLAAAGGVAGQQLGASMVTRFGETVTTKFGDVLGGAINAALPVVGALAGPLLNKLFSIGKPSKQELDARKAYTDWQSTILADFDKTATAQQKLEAGGRDWARVNISVRDAYTSIGRSGDDAMRDLGVALDATHHSAAEVQTALAHINDVFTAKQNIATGVEGIITAAKTAGGVVPESLRPIVEKLLEMKGLTDDEKSSLSSLMNGGMTDFKGLEERAGKFGISLQDLGPAFQQAHITEKGAEISKLFGDLTAAGAGAGGVMNGLGSSVTSLVQDALKYGATLPQELQPLVQHMFDVGQLVDENGVKLTDMSGIKFADTPLQKGINDLVSSIQNLIDLLTNKMPKTVDVSVNEHHTIFNHVAPDDTNMAATGGWVTGYGIQHFDGGGRVLAGRWGTDTVPAMLTPGEMVLNTNQQQAVSALMRRGSGDRSSASATDPALLAKLDAFLSKQDGIKRGLDRMPEMMSIALTSALTQTQRRRAA